MAERKLRVVTVECPECGLRAELREKAEGRPKAHFEDGALGGTSVPATVTH